MFDRLKAEFKETVTRYNRLQRDVADKVKSSAPLTRCVSGRGGEPACIPGRGPTGLHSVTFLSLENSFPRPVRLDEISRMEEGDGAS